MLRRVLLTAAALGLFSLSAHAAGTQLKYDLYHYEGGVWVKYGAAAAFPAGGNLAGTNHWRYDFQLLNSAAPSPVNTLVVFFNPDNLLHADAPPVAVTSPPGWTATYFAPPAGSKAWRERIRNLAAPLGTGLTLTGFQVEFTWHDPVLPGPVSYDAQFATGSETGESAPNPLLTSVGATSWGSLRALYR